MSFINRALPRPFAFTGGLIQRIALWGHLWRSRRALARLDAQLLDDLGLSARIAEREAAKPFWRL